MRMFTDNGTSPARLGGSSSAKSLATGFFLLLLSTFASIATATYSIVATDSKTKQVGGAGATCLPDRNVYDLLYFSVPGSSVLHTQAWLPARDDPIITTAVARMEEGASPNAVLEAMYALDLSDITYGVPNGPNITVPELSMRQYGIADFSSTAAYSGESLAYVIEAFFGFGGGEIADGGKTNLDDRYNYHAMGNIVTNGTIASLQSGFEDQDDKYNFGLCDMAGKLMTAMSRVADEGFGDMRCLVGEKPVSATGSYLHIDNADGTVLIHIDWVGSGDKEPVEAMKKQFYTWRKENPCDNASSGSSTRVSPLITVSTVFGISSFIYLSFF